MTSVGRFTILELTSSLGCRIDIGFSTDLFHLTLYEPSLSFSKFCRFTKCLSCPFINLLRDSGSYFRRLGLRSGFKGQSLRVSLPETTIYSLYKVGIVEPTLYPSSLSLILSSLSQNVNKNYEYQGTSFT